MEPRAREFCWHTFLDPDYSEAYRKTLREEPDSNSAEGYTNPYEEDSPRGKWWICHRCFEDFAPEFEWVVIDTDPDAWPYGAPEPHPRPTGADFKPPRGGWLPRPE